MAKATSKPKVKTKPKAKAPDEAPAEPIADKHAGGFTQDERELKYIAARANRVCKTPGCKTILRLSNPGVYCSPCVERKSPQSKMYVPQTTTES